MKKRLGYFLFLGLFAASPVFAQKYMHVENTGGTDSYTLSDVEVMTFTNTVLNVVSAAGTTPYVMDDVVKVFFNSAVGIEEANYTPSINVYPNPTTGIVSLDIDNGTIGDFNVSVYNFLGSLITSKSYDTASGSMKINMDMSDYTNGIYILKIDSKNATVSKRIIKQ